MGSLYERRSAIENFLLRIEYYPVEWKVFIITMIPGKDLPKGESCRPTHILDSVERIPSLLSSAATTRD